MAASRVVVGAHVLVYINGIPFAQGTGFRFESQTPHKESRGLDSLTAYELAPVGAKAGGNFTMLRLHGDGGLEGRGVVAPFRHLSRERYFSILVIDRFNGKRLVQADYCKVTSQSWNHDAKGRVMGSFSFDTIDWVNEAEYQ